MEKVQPQPENRNSTDPNGLMKENKDFSYNEQQW